MKNITVMQYNKSIKPVGDGELSEEIITNNRLGKNIEKYITPDYCLSCAYFQQTKGNFGRCTVLKNDKKFDGSKQGSGCNVWRLDKQLYDIELKTRQQKPKKELTEFEIKVKEINDARKKALKIKQIKNQQIQISNPKFTDYLHGLPYSLTSDAKPIKKINRAKCPYKIIQCAVELMKHDTLSSSDISREIKKRYEYSVRPESIRRWAKRYLPNKRWWIRSGSHRMEVKAKISNSVMLHYQQKGATKLIKSENQ